MAEESGFQLRGSAPENYELYSRFIVDPFIEEMFRRVGLATRSSVLDVACGTGRLARAAHEVLEGRGDVHGLDINAGMLAVARALSAREAKDDIVWHEATAAEMPFPDDRFDAVFCSFGIMFFPDLGVALREMVRVTEPGGMIACSFFAGPVERSPYMKALTERLEPMLQVGITAVNDQAFGVDHRQVAATLADLSVADIVADTLEPRLELPPIREYVPVHIGGLPWAADFEALADEQKEQLYTQMSGDLAAYASADGHLSVPFAIHVVSGVAR